jgi:hypothetical protein
MERQMRARTAGALPGQPDGGVVSGNCDELDIAAVGLKQRAEPIENSGDASG